MMGMEVSWHNFMLRCTCFLLKIYLIIYLKVRVTAREGQIERRDLSFIDSIPTSGSNGQG